MQQRRYTGRPETIVDNLKGTTEASKYCMHKGLLIHKLQDLASMLHAQVIIRCAGLQALDSTHIRMIGHKTNELQHLIALIESPHLMTLELGNWPAHLAPIHGQMRQALLVWLGLACCRTVKPNIHEYMTFAIQQGLRRRGFRHCYAGQGPLLFWRLTRLLAPYPVERRQAGLPALSTD